MTEEIIIDCGWYRNGWCGCETEDKKCEQIKLCRFKDDKLKQQLKRLEQENKELKKQLSSTKCYLCGEGFLTPEGARLYDENIKLVREKEALKTIIDEGRAENKRLIQECRENMHYLACMTEQRNKYKTALEKIKIEAEKFDYWGNNLTDASNVINSIKEKIDEVLR